MFKHSFQIQPIFIVQNNFSTSVPLNVKIYASAKEAVQDIPDNAKLLVGGVFLLRLNFQEIRFIFF